MDRITKLTEQLRQLQPNLPEEDFLMLNDVGAVGVGCLDGVATPEDDVQEDVLPCLNVKPINEPPAQGFSNNYVEVDGKQIDPSFLRKLDCVVSGQKLSHVSELRDVEFVFELKNHLKHRKVNHPTTCQSYLWTAIMRGKSVCCVGPPRIGKTTGYMLPLISSSISFRLDHDQSGSGVCIPYSLVLCPHGKSARKVSSETTKWIPIKANRKPHIKLICFDRASALNNRSKHIDLSSGFDVLVTTPALFLILLKRKLVSMNNCRNLIFDDADELFLIHQEESQEVHTLYIRNNHRERSKSGFGAIRVEDSLNAQVIICSESYSTSIRHIVENFVKRPIYIISDKVEEAVRARIECFARFCPGSKRTVLRDFLELYSWLDKIIICTKDSEESLEVKSMISQHDYCQILNGESKHFAFHGIKSHWISKGRRILIVDDEVLLATIATIQIDDAQCLVHYSIPESKGTFASRFIFMQSSFKSQVRCMTAIFAEPCNRIQVHELALLIKKLGADIPPGLNALRNSFPRGLCQSYASFGNCPLRGLNCYYDHFCTPQNGQIVVCKPGVGHQVRFVATSVRSANSFYARLDCFRGSENVDGTWTTSEYCKEFILNHLQKVNFDGLQVIGDLHLGTLCAIHHITEGKRSVHRVRIEEFRDNEEDVLNYIKVFHVDHGFETMAKRSDLMELPSEWSNYPPFAVKCYITRFRPKHKEPEWDQEANEIILNALRKPEVSYLTGWVSHVYNGCYWIENVEVYHQVPSLKSHLKAYKLMDLISKADLCVETSRPSFAKDISSIISETCSRWKVENQMKVVARAFITEERGDEYHLVRCSDTANQVFVRHVKFEHQLKNLEMELASSSKKPIKYFVVGLICSCIDESGTNRVKVLSVKKNKCVDVLFVDHGEIIEVDMESCFEIENKHIKQLPFQAIEVELAGVVSNWDPDRIYDLTRYPGEIFKKLLVEKLSSKPIPLVRVFVPVNDSATMVTFDDLLHLVNNGESKPGQHSFDVEKIIRETDSDSEEDEMGPEEKEARRAFEETLQKKQKTLCESMGVFLPSGGQKPMRSSNVPDPVLNGVDDEDGQDDRQLVPFDGDIAAFDYALPPGSDPLPFDDMDDDDNNESDDDVELRCNEDMDTFFEKVD